MHLTDSELIWVVALSGLATLLIRWLPMVWQARAQRGRRSDMRLRRSMDAIGPSAIIALLLTSFWGMLSAHATALTVLPIVAGLAGVVVAKRYLKSVAWGTVGGVVCYAASLWALSLL
jgi:branched-subunit amino acid transport protein